jgi:hypothetical protein
VDIGCGAGTWIKAASDLRVATLLGIDGAYAIPSLVIPQHLFKSQNIHQKIDVSGRFDLLLCLEVAEHLDRSRAISFIDELCAISSVILFSAAIPLQGGTDHRNEIWPEFWADLFKRNGYKPIDLLRDSLWDNEAVEWWYRQNMLIYLNDSAKAAHFPETPYADPDRLIRVHPTLIDQVVRELKPRKM